MVFFSLFCNLLILLMFATTVSAVASESDVRFLQGLGSRQLFESADLFFTEKTATVPANEKYPLTAEYIRVLTNQLLLSTGAAQAVLQEKLLSLEKELLDKPIDAERSLDQFSLRLQFIYAEMSLTDAMRYNLSILAETERGDQANRCRERYLALLERYKKLEDDLLTLRQTTGNRTDFQFDRETLLLHHLTRFAAGLAQESFAMTYPPGNDRAFSLQQAVPYFDEISQLDFSDPIVFQARIELARCHRLLGNPPLAENSLAMIKEPLFQTTAKEQQLQWLTEVIRVQISKGTAEAIQNAVIFSELAAQYHLPTTLYPEFDLARLELFLATSQMYTDKKVVEERMRQLLASIRQLELTHGRYWGRRAQLLLISSALPGHAQSVPLLSVLAEDRFHAGQYTESAQLYVQASSNAEKNGDKNEALRLCRLALGSQSKFCDSIQSSEKSTAAERDAATQQFVRLLRQQSLRFPDDNAKSTASNTDAADWHLKAIDIEAARQKQGDISLDEYLFLLEEHQTNWPNGEKSPAVAIRAALLYNERGKPEKSIERLSAIPIDAKTVPQFMSLAKKCFDQIPDVGDRQKAEWFEMRQANRQALIFAAQFLSRAAANEKDEQTKHELAKRTETLCAQAIQTASDISVTEKLSLHLFWAVALGIQRRQQEAVKMIERINKESIAELKPDELRRFRLTQAELFSETGQTQAAIDILAELRVNDKTDLAANELLAEILSKRSESAALDRAMQLWNEIEPQYQKNTDDWWHVREMMIIVLCRQGKREEAKEKLELWRILYPELGNAARKHRLDELLRTP